MSILFSSFYQNLGLVWSHTRSHRECCFESTDHAMTPLYAKTRLHYTLYHAALTASSRHKLFKSWFRSKIDRRQSEKGIRMKTRIKINVLSSFRRSIEIQMILQLTALWIYRKKGNSINQLLQLTEELNWKLNEAIRS